MMGKVGARGHWVTTNHQAAASKFQNLREPGADLRRAKTQISGGDSEVSTVSTPPRKKAFTEETDNTAAAKPGAAANGGLREAHPNSLMH